MSGLITLPLDGVSYSILASREDTSELQCTDDNSSADVCVTGAGQVETSVGPFSEVLPCRVVVIPELSGLVTVNDHGNTKYINEIHLEK